MHLIPHAVKQRPRWRSILAATAAALLLTATPAAAATPGHYSISATGGATFSFFTGGNLVNGVVDDQLFYLSTTGSGATKLPFALKLYNQSYTNIAISSNGNIQPGITAGGGSAAFTNTCLPTATFGGKPSVSVYWDDLYFDSNDTTEGFIEGIFTKVKGSAPHRTFTVSWQGHEFGAAGNRVAAQVIFKEGSQTVTYVYAFSGGASATVGIQSKQQITSTQWTCNSGTSTAVTSGMKLTLLHS